MQYTSPLRSAVVSHFVAWATVCILAPSDLVDTVVIRSTG